jgi:hypothetical protein
MSVLYKQVKAVEACIRKKDASAMITESNMLVQEWMMLAAMRSLRKTKNEIAGNHSGARAGR